MKQFVPPQKVNNKGKAPAKKSKVSKTKSRPINASIDHILHLQQTIGNQAVQRMIKSGALQLDSGRPQPGDVYTREVDRLIQCVEKNLSNPLSQQKTPNPNQQKGAMPTSNSTYQLTAMSYELPSMSNVETRPQTNQKVNNKGKETSKRTQGNKSKSRPIYASVDQTLHLQQTIGNHAVQRMIKSGALQLDDGRMQKGDKYPTEVAELAQRVQMSKVENKLPEGRCNALQFVKNLTPKTHVEVNDKGGRWYGQIVKVLNGRYEIRIGGTDTTKIVEEGSVTLHPTRIAMGLGAVIEPEKYVGMGKFDRSNGKMKTDDLYNCIAVAAYHETSGFASFTHYNTVGAFTYEDTGEEDKEGEWIYQMEINIESLNKLKINLLQTLGEDSDIDFYIVLGVVWKDSEDKKIQRMKTELIRGLNEVFENPQMNTDGKLTADWDPIGDFPVLW